MKAARSPVRGAPGPGIGTSDRIRVPAGTDVVHAAGIALRTRRCVRAWWVRAGLPQTTGRGVAAWSTNAQGGRKWPSAIGCRPLPTTARWAADWPAEFRAVRTPPRFRRRRRAAGAIETATRALALASPWKPARHGASGGTAHGRPLAVARGGRVIGAPACQPELHEVLGAEPGSTAKKGRRVPLLPPAESRCNRFAGRAAAQLNDHPGDSEEVVNLADTRAIPSMVGFQKWIRRRSRFPRTAEVVLIEGGRFWIPVTGPFRSPRSLKRTASASTVTYEAGWCW